MVTNVATEESRSGAVEALRLLKEARSLWREFGRQEAKALYKDEHVAILFSTNADEHGAEKVTGMRVIEHDKDYERVWERLRERKRKGERMRRIVEDCFLDENPLAQGARIEKGINGLDPVMVVYKKLLRISMSSTQEEPDAPFTI